MEDVTLLIETNGTWGEPEGSGYVAERELQELLVTKPRLIPGLTGRAVAVREFQTEVGPVDLVIVDEAGQVTSVEVKQSSKWVRRHPEHQSATELLHLEAPARMRGR